MSTSKKFEVYKKATIFNAHIREFIKTTKPDDTKNRVSARARAEYIRLVFSSLSPSHSPGAYRKIAEGKSKMSVINAVCNKLINRVFIYG